MMLVVASVGVALVVFIIYALERRSKDETIVWPDAIKLSLFGGLLTSGVVFASTAELSTISETAAAVVTEAQTVAQDMFVGTPSF
jgi:uncharacterized membrane protein YdcZ (DUF606 family)